MFASFHIDTASAEERDDPFLWLEAVTDEKALDWAREQNQESTKELKSHPEFESLRTRFISILDSNERIPYATKLGKYLYNFWRDDQNPKGLFRRTSMEEYRKPEPAWEVVLDLDKLANDEKENWVWKGYRLLYPDYELCLMILSRGGADATVVREFNLAEKSFVKEGFTLPEAKSRVSWRDRDTLYVGTDFGAGSLTDSGYARIVKEWRRGTPLEEARLVFEGKKEDVAVGAFVVHDHGIRYEFIVRSPTFWTDETLVRRGNEWIKIDKPDDAEVNTFGDQILITLRSDWNVKGRTYPAGALLAGDFEAYVKDDRNLSMLFTPTDQSSLAAVSDTKNWLIVNELDNVKNRLYRLRKNGGGWEREAMEVPGLGTVSASGVDSDESDDYWLDLTDYLTPSSLYLGTVGQGAPEKLKALPHFFKSEGLQIEQYHATSKDGTRVPYFQVSKKALTLDGSHRTLLYGYGGFEIPMLSRYNATAGAGWLERGGVYVVANIRGGGEFGPRWHQAALKENRQRAYDDFIAVAEDLIRRKVTTPRHLGIRGGSNGGLLMGNMMVQRPELFGAIVCQVPLLDMKRYNKLLAGASWMGEYGNPDTDDWKFLKKYSPYQLVTKEANYPRVLFTTSTRDDRVHPAHARKMVAKMKAQGHNVLYYENIEGGHGGAANNEQRAFMEALAYTFLWNELE